MNEWLTVSEIEQQTKIPERTIRRYVNIHGHHIQTRKQGRAVYIAEHSIPLLQKIRDWYDAGWKSERVEDALSESGLPVTVTVDGQDVAMAASDALRELQKYVATVMGDMTEEVTKLRQEVAASREESSNLRSFIETSLEERDHRLMEALRAIQASKEENKHRSWWPFWKK